jgi:hypothetical protein
MNEEQLKKMIDDTYEDSKEDTIRSMIGDFYNKKMLSTILFVWAYGLAIIGLAVFSGIRYFRVDAVKYQIMYAAIFICCIQFIALIKVFAWQMIHRNSIKREIKRLELRIAELNQTVKGKA